MMERKSEEKEYQRCADWPGNADLHNDRTQREHVQICHKMQNCTTDQRCADMWGNADLLAQQKHAKRACAGPMLSFAFALGSAAGAKFLPAVTLNRRC